MALRLEAWLAALAFTDERIEEARQVKEEIAFMEEARACAAECVADEVREGPKIQRIIVRLTRELERITLGMKPGAIERVGKEGEHDG